MSENKDITKGNVVIVAGGLGTRFGHLSVFPKILLPTPDASSILEEDIRRFSNYNIYVIVNCKYYNMVANYVRVNKLPVELICSTNCNGSYNTIKSVYDKIPHNNVLFFWSDLILDEDLPEFDVATIVTTATGHYRYEFRDKEIHRAENYDGNIPGIYYIDDTDKYFTVEEDFIENLDLIDILNSKTQAGYELDNYVLSNDLIEYRDLDIYRSILKSSIGNSNKTRFFNSIVFKEDTCVKHVIDKSYSNLIVDEYNWYLCLPDKSIGPKILSVIYDKDKNLCGFVMERLVGYKPLHEFLTSASEFHINTVYSKIYNMLDMLHTEVMHPSDSTFFADSYKELVEKVIDRCDNIKHMLINYDADRLHKLLKKAHAYFVEHADKTYAYCHGDLNGSNIMVNPDTLDVKFIDPRGYFGYTKKFGSVDYERAKLLYCLMGYDKFNINPQIYGEDWPKSLSAISSAQPRMLITRMNLILVGVIYVALAGYISQDIMKANIAYEYGINKLETILGDGKDIIQN